MSSRTVVSRRDGSFAELSGRAGSLFGTMWRDYQQSVQWKVAKEA